MEVIPKNQTLRPKCHPSPLQVGISDPGCVSVASGIVLGFAFARGFIMPRKTIKKRDRRDK